MRCRLLLLVTLPGLLSTAMPGGADDTCPSWTPLAVTCENGVCNRRFGENATTCPEFLHPRGKALGYNVPGYGDISIGGFLAVGGHGSNATGSATISSLVVSVDKMDPQGRIQTHDAECGSPTLWRALRGDLGMLGMTVRIRLRIRDQFHVRRIP